MMVVNDPSNKALFPGLKFPWGVFLEIVIGISTKTTLRLMEMEDEVVCLQNGHFPLIHDSLSHRIHVW